MTAPDENDVHIRVNAVGYVPYDNKVAIAFSMKPVRGNFVVIEKNSRKKIFSGDSRKSAEPGYGPFKHYYELDFSTLQKEGSYEIQIPSRKYTVHSIIISASA